MEQEIPDKRQFQNQKYRLLRLAKNANILDQKAVTTYITTLKRKDQTTASKGYQKCLFTTYSRFCRLNQIPFYRPRMKCTYPIPLIPTTANIEKIINASTRRGATIFKIMAETAVEGMELHKTHRNQIDAENGIISIKGCKGHTNGLYKLKTTTAEMLRQYLAKHQDPYPFPDPRAMSECWQYYRRRASRKLCEPELMKITLKSLRNYAGAIFYYGKGNKDPIATQRFMRHTRLDTTQHYLQAIIIPEDEEYTTKTVQLGTPTTLKEITELSDNGYQKFTEADGYQIFRKRK